MHLHVSILTIPANSSLDIKIVNHEFPLHQYASSINHHSADHERILLYIHWCESANHKFGHAEDNLRSSFSVFLFILLSRQNILKF